MINFPRVTDVLRPFTNFDYVPKDILTNAARRGTIVHSICSGIANGDWVPESMIDEEYRGYVKSFNLWAKAQVAKFIVIEKRYTDEHLKYTGEVDFVVMGFDDQLYLVDIKTSASPQKTYPVQLAAYENLLRVHKIEVKDCMIVYLDKNGEFPDIHMLGSTFDELCVFVSALECWKYFNKGKKKCQKKSIENS
jgi:hypothetical protein